MYFIFQVIAVCSCFSTHVYFNSVLVLFFLFTSCLLYIFVNLPPIFMLTIRPLLVRYICISQVYKSSVCVQ